MSRIGRKPITVPKDVEIRIVNGEILVKGPKGELKKSLPSALKIKIEEGKVLLMPESFQDLPINRKNCSASWGLYRALVANMIKGVSMGFDKTLIFQGIGFRAAVTGRDLELHLGFSHPVIVKAPEGILCKVEKGKILISGIDKELVGQVAAEIRSKKPPEPYKGSGIRYEEEVIIRKAGKKAATTSS